MAFVQFAGFLAWNETRNGPVIYDPILSLFNPVDVTGFTFFFTYLGISVGILFSLRKPLTFYYLLTAILWIMLLRSICLYAVPLSPPPGMILLRDSLLESTFYSGDVLTKDLFFSGHTSNVCLIAFLTQYRPLKIFLFILAFLVGSLVLAQHVHYSIDVSAAPIFAYFAYGLSQWSVNYFFIPKGTPIPKWTLW
jgi:hypothetical protein